MQVPPQQGFELTSEELLSRVRRRTILLVFLIVVLASAAQLSAESAPPVTLVKAGRLLDPRTGNVLAPAAVLIEGDRIKQVGPPLQIHTPVGTTTIDLGNATLLPGLIDSHTHLFLDVIVPPEAEILRHPNGEFAPGLLLAIVESPTKRAHRRTVGERRFRERHYHCSQPWSFRYRWRYR